MSTHLGQFSQMCSLGHGMERRWSEGVAPGLLPMAACGSQHPPTAGLTFPPWSPLSLLTLITVSF